MNKSAINYHAIFCNRLKELRQVQGLRQEDIAQKLQIPVSTYANWEQGRREPSIQDIFKLLQAFGINADELFYCEYNYVHSKV